MQWGHVACTMFYCLLLLFLSNSLSLSLSQVCMWQCFRGRNTIGFHIAWKKEATPSKNIASNIRHFSIFIKSKKLSKTHLESFKWDVYLQQSEIVKKLKYLWEMICVTSVPQCFHSFSPFGFKAVFTHTHPQYLCFGSTLMWFLQLLLSYCLYIAKIVKLRKKLIQIFHTFVNACDIFFESVLLVI